MLILLKIKPTHVLNELDLSEDMQDKRFENVYSNTWLAKQV